MIGNYGGSAARRGAAASYRGASDVALCVVLEVKRIVETVGADRGFSYALRSAAPR